MTLNEGRITPKTARVLSSVFSFFAWSNFVVGVVAVILCIYLPIALTRLDASFLTRVNQARGAVLPSGSVDFNQEWPVIYNLIVKFAGSAAFQIRVVIGVVCMFVAWAVWRRAAELVSLATSGGIVSDLALRKVRGMSVMLLLCFGGYVSDLVLYPRAIDALSKTEWTWVQAYPYRLMQMESQKPQEDSGASTSGQWTRVAVSAVFGLVAPNFDGLNSLILSGLGFWFVRREKSKRHISFHQIR